MICKILSRKLKKFLGIKPRQIFIYDNARAIIDAGVVIENSRIELRGDAVLNILPGCILRNCYLKLNGGLLLVQNNSVCIDVNYFADNAKVVFGEETNVSSYDFMLSSAQIQIGNKCFLYKGRNVLRPYISINNGELVICHHNVIKNDFWIRFGGKCNIGSYNCINERTEIRCDENITIGDYNMISYECNIWDTNTHVIYDKEKRREMTRRDFPNIGNEIERPKTRPILIEDDTWIGKRVNILKGTTLRSASIVGVGTTISGKEIQENLIAVSANIRVY